MECTLNPDRHASLLLFVYSMAVNTCY